MCCRDLARYTGKKKRPHRGKRRPQLPSSCLRAERSSGLTLQGKSRLWSVAWGETCLEETFGPWLPTCSNRHRKSVKGPGTATGSPPRPSALGVTERLRKWWSALVRTTQWAARHPRGISSGRPCQPPGLCPAGARGAAPGTGVALPPPPPCLAGPLVGGLLLFLAQPCRCDLGRGSPCLPCLPLSGTPSRTLGSASLTPSLTSRSLRTGKALKSHRVQLPERQIRSRGLDVPSEVPSWLAAVVPRALCRPRSPVPGCGRQGAPRVRGSVSSPEGKVNRQPDPEAQGSSGSRAQAMGGRRQVWGPPPPRLQSVSARCGHPLTPKPRFTCVCSRVQVFSPNHPLKLKQLGRNFDRGGTSVHSP